MIRFDSKVLHITATIQISNMGARFLADAASVVESREKELGEQETMNKAMELLVGRCLPAQLSLAEFANVGAAAWKFMCCSGSPINGANLKYLMAATSQYKYTAITTQMVPREAQNPG